MTLKVTIEITAEGVHAGWLLGVFDLPSPPLEWDADFHKMARETIDGGISGGVLIECMKRMNSRDQLKLIVRSGGPNESV